MKSTLLSALVLAGICLTGPALAASALAPDPALDHDILQIEHEWARINYEVPEQRRLDAFKQLEKTEDALAKRYPGRPEPLIWEGITYSSHAGAKGGLGALGLAKEARNLLQAAEKIDPGAMHGSIYTSLGTLYYKLPGWPISFGDDDKAETLLKTALRINPNGIDPNYFYADFLFGHHKYREAMQYLRKAQSALPRPARPLADEGRKQEIRALMAKIREKLGDTDNA